jgi:NitT/TauT family transport system substrate-binding protein
MKNRLASIAIFAALLAAFGAGASERVVFGTDWRVPAEHSGFYQAMAGGFYKYQKLDVVTRQGGPRINHAQLLAAGNVTFALSSNSFIPLNYVREKNSMVAVAAIFQKDRRC